MDPSKIGEFRSPILSELLVAAVLIIGVDLYFVHTKLSTAPVPPVTIQRNVNGSAAPPNAKQ